jgi:hypothetical protein
MTDNPKFGPLPPADDDAWLRAAFAVAAAMLNEWHPDDPVEIV